MHDLETNQPTVCAMGPKDVLPQESNAESFFALKIETPTDFRLEITKYNLLDYSAPKIRAGYICEREGKINVT